MLVDGSANFATGDAIGSSPPLTFIPGMDETSEWMPRVLESEDPTYLNQRGKLQQSPDCLDPEALYLRQLYRATSTEEGPSSPQIVVRQVMTLVPEPALRKVCVVCCLDQ